MLFGEIFSLCFCLLSFLLFSIFSPLDLPCYSIDFFFSFFLTHCLCLFFCSIFRLDFLILPSYPSVDFFPLFLYILVCVCVCMCVIFSRPLGCLCFIKFYFYIMEIVPLISKIMSLFCGGFFCSL